MEFSTLGLLSVIWVVKWSELQTKPNTPCLVLSKATANCKVVSVSKECASGLKSDNRLTLFSDNMEIYNVIMKGKTEAWHCNLTIE